MARAIARRSRSLDARKSKIEYIEVVQNMDSIHSRNARGVEGGKPRFLHCITDGLPLGVILKLMSHVPDKPH